MAKKKKISYFVNKIALRADKLAKTRVCQKLIMHTTVSQYLPTKKHNREVSAATKSIIKQQIKVKKHK